jgi:glycosyltransferase involved in cell wall biosynthesis
MASRGEGFGCPIVEAQSAGTPVICTDGSAMSELCGAGWVVSSTPDWEDGHCGWWQRPDVDDIEQAYEAAWQAREDGGMPALKKAARDYATLFDIDRVFQQYMIPVLGQIEDRIG